MEVKVLQVGPIGTNCYILEDEKARTAAIIDPGDEAGRILQVIEDDGVDVKYILLTHGHYDHTTAVPQLHKALPQAEIYIHRADANGAGSQLFPLAGGRALLRGHSVCRLLRPHRPGGGQLCGDHGLPEKAGAAARGLPRLPRPRRDLHPGAGAAEQPVPAGSDDALTGTALSVTANAVPAPP